MRTMTAAIAPVVRGRMDLGLIVIWIAALLVSLGLVGSIEIGYYQFRLGDVLFFGSAWLLLTSLTRANGLSGALLATLLWLAFRLTAEWNSAMATGTQRALLGTAATFATPLIYVAVRQARIPLHQAKALLIIAWVVALLSQFHLLPYGENAATGTLDIGYFLGLERLPEFAGGYSENTVAVWRALSAAIAVTAVLLPLPTKIRVVAFIGCILQFGGGGGGRSLPFFLALAPFAVLFANRPRQNSRAVTASAALAVALALGALYIFNPIAALMPVKGATDITHAERVLQTLRLATVDRELAVNEGGLDGRLLGYDYYWEQITTDPSVMWNGVGLNHGAAFEANASNPNGPAHNAILDIWALAGVAGVASFGFFLFWCLRDLYFLQQSTGRSVGADAVALSFAVAWLYLFQYVMFQAAALDRSMMAVFYLIAGCLRPLALELNGPAEVANPSTFSRTTLRRGAIAWRTIRPSAD